MAVALYKPRPLLVQEDLSQIDAFFSGTSSLLG
jgi:hypothetical protein